MASSGSSANVKRPYTAAGRQRMPPSNGHKRKPRDSRDSKEAMSNLCKDDIPSFGTVEFLQSLSTSSPKTNKARRQTFFAQKPQYAYGAGHVHGSSTREQAPSQSSHSGKVKRHVPKVSDNPLEDHQQREQQHAQTTRVRPCAPSLKAKHAPTTVAGNMKKRISHRQEKNTINVDGKDEPSIVNVDDDAQEVASVADEKSWDIGRVPRKRKAQSSGTTLPTAEGLCHDNDHKLLGFKSNSSQLDSDTDIAPVTARIVHGPTRRWAKGASDRPDVLDDTHEDGSATRKMVEDIQKNDMPSAFAETRKQFQQATTESVSKRKKPPNFDSWGSANRKRSSSSRKGLRISPGQTLMNQDLSSRQSLNFQPLPLATTLTGKRKQTTPKGMEKASTKQQEVIDICEDDDDDEIEQFEASESTRTAPGAYCLPRLAIGSTVFRKQCRAIIVNDSIELHFNRLREGRTRRSSLEEVDCILDLEIRDLKQFSYHSVGDEHPPDHQSFVALTVDKDAHEHVQKFCPEYNAAANEQIFRFIVLEFDSPRRLEQFCDQLRNLPGDPCQLSQKITTGVVTSAEEASQLCVALTEDYATNESSPRKKKKRKAFELWEEPPCLKGKADEDVLLVYPFAGSKNEMEKAAFGLFRFFGPTNEKLNAESSAECRTEEEPGNGRSHYLTVTAGDCRRLEPGVYLNDTLIDFFMQWMHRNEPEESSLHYFSTHFYTQLAEKGSEGVRRWTEKKRIDIFKKRLIFVPINKVLHWSLAVIINPGAVQIEVDVDNKDQQCAPLIVFFDSLSMHKKAVVGKKLRAWLNAEWKRQKGSSDNDDGGPFTKESIPTFTPRAPRQQNGYDCGVFVCRNAFGMTQLKDCSFTIAQIGDKERRENFFNDEMSHPFLYTNDDIDNLRKELLDFLGSLSNLYLPWNAEQKRLRVERKKAKKSEDTTVDETSDTNSHSADSRLLSPESSTVEIIEHRSLAPRALIGTGAENTDTVHSGDDQPSPNSDYSNVLNNLKRNFGGVNAGSKTRSRKKRELNPSSLNLTKVNHPRKSPPTSSNGSAKGTSGSPDVLEDCDNDGAPSSHKKRSEIDLTSQGSSNSDSSKVISPHDTLFDVGVSNELQTMQPNMERKQASRRARKRPDYYDVEKRAPKTTLLGRSERPRRSGEGDSLSEVQGLKDSDEDSEVDEKEASSPPSEKESNKMPVESDQTPEPKSSPGESVTNCTKETFRV